MQQRKNNITFLEVRFRSGCNREGAQYAPDWLFRALGLTAFNSRVVPLSTEKDPLSDDINNGVTNYVAVLQMIDAVREDVKNVLDYGNRVVVLGGDHSIAVGSISGVLSKYPNIGVIWFDAHTDINTEATSPSGNAHGMPLAALMGLCKSEINNQGHLLNPQNVYWVGARSIDDGEREIIKRLGIEGHVYTAEKVHQIGMGTVMHQIRTALDDSGVKQIHLSFDIDGMDPLLVPATGTPVEAGLNEIECNAFIDAMTEGMPELVSMDFVEYNPKMDDLQKTTGKWCANTLSKLYNLFVEDDNSTNHSICI